MERRLSGLVLLGLSALLGCDYNNKSTPAFDLSSSPPETYAESCAIALIPHQGEDLWDLQIVRLQQEARRAAEPMAYLEKLGWALVAKARASNDPGFYKLAEQCARCIEEKTPDAAEGLLLRAHVLHNLHQFKEAEALARRLVGARGLSFDYGVLGDALVEQGKLVEAVEAYQEMMDQKPSPQAYSRAAHIRWLKGELPGAIELMRMTVGASGSGDPESAAWARVRLALYELQAGRAAEATRLIAAALTLKPDYAPALLARGRMELAEGKNADAVQSLTRAAQLNPLPEYQWVLIDALRVAGREEDAEAVEIRLMDRGATEDPRTFALYLATVDKSTALALRLAEEEMEVRADVFTLDALAWAFRAAGRISEARAFSKRALAEGTQDARLFLHAGVIAAESGHIEEAERWFEEAMAIPQMLLPSEREQLGTALAALNAAGADGLVTKNQNPERRTT